MISSIFSLCSQHIVHLPDYIVNFARLEWIKLLYALYYEHHFLLSAYPNAPKDWKVVSRLGQLSCRLAALIA